MRREGEGESCCASCLCCSLSSYSHSFSVQRAASLSATRAKIVLQCMPRHIYYFDAAVTTSEWFVGNEFITFLHHASTFAGVSRRECRGARGNPKISTQRARVWHFTSVFAASRCFVAFWSQEKVPPIVTHGILWQYAAFATLSTREHPLLLIINNICLKKK